MPSLGAAEEVHEENDGYDYDDDFEVGYSLIYVIHLYVQCSLSHCSRNLVTRTVLFQIVWTICRIMMMMILKMMKMEMKKKQALMSRYLKNVVLHIRLYFFIYIQLRI